MSDFDNYIMLKKFLNILKLTKKGIHEFKTNKKRGNIQQVYYGHINLETKKCNLEV